MQTTRDRIVFFGKTPLELTDCLKAIQAEVSELDCETQPERISDKGPIDLALIDIDADRKAGLKALAWACTLPPARRPLVIALSKDPTPEARQRCFEQGACDYWLTPISCEELNLRLSVWTRVLDQIRTRGASSQVLSAPGIEIDFGQDRLRIGTASGSDAPDLTPIELRIFKYLAKNLGRTVSATDIHAAVWSSGVKVGLHSVYTHVYLLRKKLGRHAGLIRSAGKAGYRLELLAGESASTRLTSRFS